tara:strand:+ start:526 stop:666 length:141 start_codon:yes stop_codon:yes gene_type:complete
MNKSNISDEIIDQLKAIVGENNFIDDVKNMNPILVTGAIILVEYLH